MLWAAAAPAEPKESSAEVSVLVLTISSKRFHVFSDKDVSSVACAALISLLTVEHKTFSCSSVSRWGKIATLCAVADAAPGAPGLKTVHVFATTSFVYSLLSSPHSCPIIFFPVLPGFFVSSFQTWISFSFSCRSLKISLAELQQP